jgi:hypothetical protein
MASRKTESALNAPEHRPLNAAIASAMIEHLEKQTHGDALHYQP